MWDECHSSVSLVNESIQQTQKGACVAGSDRRPWIDRAQWMTVDLLWAEFLGVAWGEPSRMPEMTLAEHHF